jgi:hypothetical protein
VMIRWICSSVALGCVITIIFLSRGDQNGVGRNFLQAQIQRRTKPDVSINIGLLTRPADVFCMASVSEPPYGISQNEAKRG